ncbi:GNAT family N-acetyltransferase [Agromyces albus]|uniref:GNAT family N-acetyltransferase n=1 Tax=Agromyces albus TaxID=205332 RepID=UPI0027D81BA0|nr:GNAT family N-acetyltransferase [Agromyces albus]
MHDITIRPASSADAEALADLAAETFPLACPPHTTPEAIAAFIAEHFTVARFGEYLADERRAILVAEDDGRLVGYSMLITGEPGDADAAAALTVRPVVELSKFYTRALAHGTGVAAPLMSATLAAAAAATGARAVWLGVNEENARAIRFYERSTASRRSVASTSRSAAGSKTTGCSSCRSTELLLPSTR